jgi:hypothetical protein
MRAHSGPMSAADTIEISLQLLAVLVIGRLLWRTRKHWHGAGCPYGVPGCKGWGAGKPDPCEKCHYDSCV